MRRQERPPNPHQTLRNQKARELRGRKPGGNRGKGKVQSARGNRGIVSCLESHHRFRLEAAAADALSLRRGRPARREKRKEMGSWGERQSAGHRAELNRVGVGGKQSRRSAAGGQSRREQSVTGSRVRHYRPRGTGATHQKIIKSPHALSRCCLFPFLLFIDHIRTNGSGTKPLLDYTPAPGVIKNRAGTCGGLDGPGTCEVLDGRRKHRSNQINRS